MLSTLTDFIRDLQLGRFVRVREEHRSDWISPLCIILLGITGVFFIYSAQSYDGGTSWKMQIVWLMLGCTIYWTIAFTNYKFFLEYAHLIYIASVILLVPLAIEAMTPLDLPFVTSRFGSTRWLDFGPFSIQPSETAKVGALIMAASILARSEISSFKDSFKVLAKVFFTLALPILLIFQQPDLGSSLVFPPMVFALLYVSNLPKRFFTVAIALFALAVSVVSVDIWRYHHFLQTEEISADENVSRGGLYQSSSFIPLRDYQRNRILAFAAPQVVDPKGNGISWNLNQSLFAVASGGFFGKGLGEGTQARLGYLPSTVAPNDFIYSVLAEEAGFIGGLAVIVLFSVLILNGIRIAGMSRDRFGTLLAVGVSVIFMVHVFINIGMTIGLMPITGLPLPFMSYGGSFVLSCCILQGLVQSVYRFRKDFS